MAGIANVNTPSLQYEKLEKIRLITRDLNEGITRLREPDAAAVYLPRNPTESIETVPGVGIVDPWQNRVNMSRLKNMFKEAVEDCVGRAFAKNAKFRSDTPEELVRMMDDVDGRGTNFHVFGMNVAQASTAEGEDYVLVDYPTVPATENMTQAEWEKLKRAPFWRRYPAKTVIDWQHEPFGKEQRLTMVRLRERALVTNGPWTKKAVDQVRVLRCGNPLAPVGDPMRYATWQVWRPVEDGKVDGEWAVVAFGSMKPQVDIPFVDFPFLLAAQFEAYPAFLDLAHLTIAHYQKMSSLDNAQHVSGFPILHWAGGPIDPETKRPVPLGQSRMFVSPDSAAKVEFIEPQGKAWDSLRTELSAMEADARELASEPLSASAPGNLTATGESIRAAKASSRLEAAVLGWQDSFNKLFYYTAQYMGVVEYGADSGWGGVELNRRFVPVSRNIEGFKAALEMHAAKRMSDETLFEVAQASEIEPESIDFAEEESRIARSKPTQVEVERKAALQLVEANAKAKADTSTANQANSSQKGNVTKVDHNKQQANKAGK